jgi:hypothetical protein
MWAVFDLSTVMWTVFGVSSVMLTVFWCEQCDVDCVLV